MTVKTPVLTDASAQTVTTYNGNIDANFNVADRISWAFAPHEQSTPGMTLRLEAGYIPAVGELPLEVAAQSTDTIALPSANPRCDIVYIDAADGTVGVATGTEASSPSDPEIPEGKIAVARITLSTSQTAITNLDIDDLRCPPSVSAGVPTFAIPVGFVGYYAASSIPIGWLEANGADISRTIYADLFDVIGTTYGEGDGETTFALPDLRGEFIRGWDNGRGVDIQQMLGSVTSGSMAITGLFDTQTLYVGQSVAGSAIPTGATVASINSSTAITISAAATATATVTLTFAGRAFGSAQDDCAQITLSPGPGGGPIQNLYVYGIGYVVEQSGNNSSTYTIGGLETRPRNNALLACIKY